MQHADVLHDPLEVLERDAPVVVDIVDPEIAGELPSLQIRQHVIRLLAISL